MLAVALFALSPLAPTLVDKLQIEQSIMTERLWRLLLLPPFAAGFVDDRAVVDSFTPGGTTSLAAAVALAWGATAVAGSRFREKARRFLQVLLPIPAGLLLLGILLFNVLGPEHIQNIEIFWFSFNAFFYSAVQVFSGKELLVDFVNHYGLYPHFLEPLFHLVGLRWTPCLGQPTGSCP